MMELAKTAVTMFPIGGFAVHIASCWSVAGAITMSTGFGEAMNTKLKGLEPAEENANRTLGVNAWNQQPIQKHQLAKHECPNLDEYDQDGMVEIDGPYIPITRPRRKYRR
jgi:hypothetical protein